MNIDYLFNCIKSILTPITDGIVYFFSSFIREDMVIFGAPYYIWVFMLFFGGFLLSYFLWGD